MTTQLGTPTLLIADEVAAMFHVDKRTVDNWARAGLLPSIRTPGRHYRFDEDVVLQILADQAEGLPGGVA